MSDELYYEETFYCSLCDKNFISEGLRSQHVQHSKNHPQCEPCGRRFANMNGLRNHYSISPRHHWCMMCRREFGSAAGLRVHLDLAPVHREFSDSEEEDDIDDFFEGNEDAVGRTMYPDEGAQHNGPPATDDEEVPEEPEFWDEDEYDMEEEEAAYYADVLSGWNRLNLEESVPTSGSGDQLSTASTPTSESGSGTQTTAVVESKAPHHASHNHAATDSEDEDDDESTRVGLHCPLCLEVPRESSATRCGHLFCTLCINGALKIKRSCPVCRKDAHPRQLRTIYLPFVNA